jgi:PAS domain S-box
MKPVKVLLVEDERLSSLHTATMLRKRGYEVIEAASGEAAVEAVARGKGTIDIALMDIALGEGMDGFEAARSILKLRDLPIVFLSVRADDEAVAKASELSSYGFVAKDQGSGILDASIRMALRLFEAQARLTERNESLAESENRFRKLFELNPDALLISTVDGTIIDANASFCDLYGVERPRLVGARTMDPSLSIWKLAVHREDYVSMLKERGEVQGLEVEFKRGDGSDIVALLSGRVMEIDGERRILSVIHDISDKKAAQRALESQARIESFVGKATQLMLYEEDERKILEGACRIAVEAGRFSMAWIGLASAGEDVIRCAAAANLDDEEMRGIELHLSGPSADAGISNRAVRRRASVICGDIERDEAPGPWRDGCLARGFRSAAAFPLIVGQRIIGVYSVYATEPMVFGAAESSMLEQLAMDLSFVLDLKQTEREKAEAERLARESDMRYRESFIQSAAAKLLVAFKNGAIVDANEAASRFYGYSREQLLSMSVADLNAYNKDSVEERMARVMRGETSHFEVKHRLASGELRDVEVFSSPIRVEGAVYLHSIIHDITEQKKAEEELERLVAEKETLLKELQHRVKNNLNVISGLLSLEADKCRDGEAQAAFDAAISRVGAIAAVYEKLYASEDLASIDMGPYAEELARTLFETYNLEPERIRLKTDFGELRLDTKRCVPFGLALNELLSNALKYAYPGTERGELRVSLKPEGGDAVLVVEDDGPGVPERYRGEDVESMGMSLVRMLVKQLKGEFSLDCARGTRASIRFPM